MRVEVGNASVVLVLNARSVLDYRSGEIGSYVSAVAPCVRVTDESRVILVERSGY